MGYFCLREVLCKTQNNLNNLHEIIKMLTSISNKKITVKTEKMTLKICKNIQFTNVHLESLAYKTNLYFS